jgi:hypothetical protein
MIFSESYSEYIPYDEPVYKKTSLYCSFWNELKRIRDTINHRASFIFSKQKKQKTINIVTSANIVGMDLEEARKLLPNITIRDYGIDKTQAHCTGRCNVYVDENNIITKIVNFG